MNVKIPLLFLLFLIFAASPELRAQAPDTVTLKAKNFRYKKAILTTKAGDQEEGFMAFHFPYSPDNEVQLIPLDGNVKKAVTYKVKQLASINYADLRYEQIIPDNDRLEYLARKATDGALTLYTFTEKVKAPAVIPMAGYVTVLSIPYDHSLFFIDKGAGIKLINRSNYQQELLEFVGDNAELAKKIKDKTYKYRDIETVVMAYNTWVATNESSK